MDQHRSDRRTVGTRGQAKRQKLEENLKAQGERFQQSFQTGGQGINNLVDQALGKIKIENVTVVKKEGNVDESQADVHLENAFKDNFLNLDVTNEGENSFFEETHEQKVLVVSSEMDCEQDDIINLPGQASFHSNQNILANFGRLSPICAGNLLTKETLEDMDCEQNAIINSSDEIIDNPQASSSNYFQSNENTSVNLAKLNSICDISDEHELVTNDGMNVQSAVNANIADLLDHVENVVCEDVEDVSPGGSAVHCKCPCWKEIMKLKEVIQCMDKKIQSLAQPSTTVFERCSHVEYLEKGAEGERTTRNNLVDQNPEKMSIKNVFMVKIGDTNEGSQPIMLPENIDETYEKICANNGKEDSKVENDSHDTNDEGKDSKDNIDEIRLRNIYVDKKLLDPDWLQTVNKNSRFKHLIRNKTPCGYLCVIDDGRYQKKPGFQDAMNAVTGLLEKIGPKLNNFSYELQGNLSCSPVHWYKSLHTWITLMPHLKKLTIDCHGNISKTYKQILEKAVCYLEFPQLTILETLNIFGVSSSIVQSALISNSKFIKDFATFDLHVNRLIVFFCLDFLYVSIRDSKINCQYFNNVTAPLQKLHWNFFNLDGIRLNVITQAVEHFRNTLTSLKLYFVSSACKYEEPIKLRLPNLTNLELTFSIHGDCTSSRFQGWTYEFFLNVVSQLTSLRELKIKGVCAEHFQYGKGQNHSSLSDQSRWDFWEGELKSQRVFKLWIKLPCLQKFELSLSLHTVKIVKGRRCSRVFKFKRPTNLGES